MGEKARKKKKIDTNMVTYELYAAGLAIDEIVEKRNLSPTTIFSHLAKLYADGKDINIYDFVTAEEVEIVRKAKEALESPVTLKPYFDYLNAEMEYFKIRLALTILNS
jgi:ATP-dependent DNA helicase RecQ